MFHVIQVQCCKGSMQIYINSTMARVHYVWNSRVFIPPQFSEI